MTGGDKFANTQRVTRNTRPIQWIKAARKEFEDIHRGARDDLLDALTAVAELALRHRGDAFRLVYALLIGADVWVVHAFQKKSNSGIAMPRQDIDVGRDRLKRLKEALR